MNVNVFRDRNGKALTIKSRKSAIYLYEGESESLDNWSGGNYRAAYKFDAQTLESLYEYLWQEANASWTNIQLVDVTSVGNDYAEYYDRELDNNGGAVISSDELAFVRVAPHLACKSSRLFKFNKSKIQTYLHDFKKVLEKVEVEE